MHYHHNHLSLYHRNAKVLYAALNKRFYWVKMDSDIKIYVSQCLCIVIKHPHRQQVGCNDIGYESVYFISQPNEILFMDLYGLFT